MGVFLEVLNDFPEVAVIMQPSFLKHKPKHTSLFIPNVTYGTFTYLSRINCGTWFNLTLLLFVATNLHFSVNQTSKQMHFSFEIALSELLLAQMVPLPNVIRPYDSDLNEITLYMPVWLTALSGGPSSSSSGLSLVLSTLIGTDWIHSHKLSRTSPQRARALPLTIWLGT